MKKVNNKSLLLLSTYLLYSPPFVLLLLLRKQKHLFLSYCCMAGSRSFVDPCSLVVNLRRHYEIYLMISVDFHKWPSWHRYLCLLFSSQSLSKSEILRCMFYSPRLHLHKYSWFFSWNLWNHYIIHGTIIFYAENYSEHYIEIQIKSHSAHTKIIN